jgi:hypothetical protein
MNSKSLLTIATSILAVCLQMPFAAAETVFEDDFSGAKGDNVDGRVPSIVNMKSAAFSGNPQIVLSGNGKAVSVNGGGAVSIPLPELAPNSVISVSAEVVSSGLPMNWIGIGFTESAATLSGFGVLSMALRPDGAMRVFSGPQKGGTYFYQDARAVTQVSETATAPSTLELTYDAKTRQVTAKVNGSEVYRGVVPEIPLSRMKFVTLQLAGQTPANKKDAGYFESFQVSVTAP